MARRRRTEALGSRTSQNHKIIQTKINQTTPLPSSWHPERTGSSKWECGKAEVAYYLNHTMRLDDAVRAGLEKAAFESTTDYIWVSPGPRGSVEQRP
jgi:hypothetical protein